MRRECPTAWQLVLGECRTGQRRHTGTQRGENYQRILAHLGEGDHESPSPYERTLGELVTPTCSGRAVDIVNTVTRDTGIDAMDWDIGRVLSMTINIEREANARPSPDA